MNADANPAPSRRDPESELETSPVPPLSPGVFELKFLLTDGEFERVLTWARGALAPDPHAMLRGGDAYFVNSLYFDTPELDVYHQSRGYKVRKFRVRRYGSEDVLYLEEKKKKDGVVRKRRTSIAYADLPWLAFDTSTPGFAGAWFRASLREGRLVPACRISYERVARVGGTADSPFRLTLDRRIVCARSEGLELGDLDGRPVRPLEKCVLELKYRDALPAPFRQLVDQHDLEATPFSKYRSSAERQGLDGPKPESRG